MRTEYDEPLYTELALEALAAWRSPEWEGIFHETVSSATYPCLSND
jgi:sarcosine oxidase / L-pipecolate oxidase